MVVNAPRKIPLSEVLEAGVPDAELDRLLAERHDEVEVLLAEAREAQANGQYAPLEPLHEFLRRARERLSAAR
jgi:hypothetical protein